MQPATDTTEHTITNAVQTFLSFSGTSDPATADIFTKEHQEKDEERAIAINHFIEKNKNLIENEAKKRFGECFNRTEVYSEAVLALAQACHKWNKKKRTKLTSLWWFYFQKQLDQLQTIGAYDSPSQARAATASTEEEDDYENWQMQQAAMETDNDDLLDSYPENEDADNHYAHSVNSFLNICMNNPVTPNRLLRAMTTLASNLNYRKKINTLKEIYAMSEKDDIIMAIQQDMRQLTTHGYTIYRAECLIDTPESHAHYLTNRNTFKKRIAFACAKTEEEAHSHFREFGEVIRCHQFTGFTAP